MKTIKFLGSMLLLAWMVSCSSIQVHADYDKNANFVGYKSFGFLKSGIDKVEISELDKKRILRAIENEMLKKGFVKSETPDLLVNIFTKTRQEINVNQYNNGWGYGFGWGWNPYMWGGYQTTVNSNNQGTLFIDLIDASRKELVWQGEGTGYLTKDVNKKDEVIQCFVNKILAQYPPMEKK